MATAENQETTAITLEVRIRRRRGDSYPIELSDDGGNFSAVDTIAANAFQEALQNRTPKSGAHLSSLLFSNQIRYAYLDAERKAQADPNKPLHFRLRIDDTAAELQALPWEETIELNGFRLATGALTPFARSLPTKGGGFQPLRTAPVHILIAFANAAELESSHSVSAQDLLDVEAEIEMLRYTLEDLQRERQVQVTLRPGSKPLKRTLVTQLHRAGFQIVQGVNTLVEIRKSLTDSPYHIVHLVASVSTATADHRAVRGVKTVDGDVIAEVFYLDHDEKGADTVTDYALLEMLTTVAASPSQWPRLLILPTVGANTSTLNPHSVLPPLAAQLVQEGVPAVLSLPNQLSAQQNHDFLNSFYTDLLAHGIVDLAANQGRQKLVDQVGPEQLVPLPILWTSAPDGALFVPIGEREREAKAAEGAPTPAVDTATRNSRINQPNAIGQTGADEKGQEGKADLYKQSSPTTTSYPQTSMSESADMTTPHQQAAPDGQTPTTTSDAAAQPSNTPTATSHITAQTSPPTNGSGTATNENATIAAQEVDLLRRLGDLATQAGDVEKARSWYEQALSVSRTEDATGLVAAPTTGVAQPAAAGVSTSGLSNLNIAVDLSVYEPPKPSDTLVIKIFSKSVVLSYDGVEYTGPNLLDDQERWEALLAARLDKTHYGRLLFDSIIHDKISPGGTLATTTVQGYGRALQGTQGKLRVQLLLGPNELNLHEQQWEYLWAPQTVTPLAVLERSPFYRLLDGVNKDLFIEEDTRLKVLVAIANPTTLEKPGHPYLEKLSRLTVALERTIVEDALQRLKAAALVEYKILDREHGAPVTLDRLREALQEGYHVLHLLAHGVFIKDTADPYHLVLEKEDGSHAFVAANQFGALLTGGSKLRLTVLAACQSANSETGNTLRGLGPRLVIEAGIPAVIGMQEQIPITTAQLFTQHFYDDLARSGRVDMAMAATRLALYQKEDATLGAWGIPVLLMSAKDGKLLDIDPARAAGAPQLMPGLKSYNQLPGGDPRPQILTQALAAQARALGAPQLVNALQEAVDKRWLDSTPAPVQDRERLTAQLTLGAKLRATGVKSLQAAIEATKLVLPLTIYGQLASALNTGKHIILIGPPGTGKTTLANTLGSYAKQVGLNTGVMSTTATADWTTFDTVGGYVPTVNGTLQFRPASFLSAIGAGQWLIIDEINRAEIDKAFGELFTVLSGQGVDLPYRVGKAQVRIRAADRDGKDGWIPQEAQDYDYIVHPNWRIIGTMNVYDKAALFTMSLAFMRRFAFVDVDLPSEAQYQTLCDSWIDQYAMPVPPAVADPAWAELKTLLTKLLTRQSILMQKRALGPAIVRDMIDYMGDRFPNRAVGETMSSIAAEALLLYAVPQLDGLDHQSIDGIYSELSTLLEQVGRTSGLLGRIAAFYPTILQWSADREEGQR